MAFTQIPEFTNRIYPYVDQDDTFIARGYHLNLLRGGLNDVLTELESLLGDGSLGQTIIVNEVITNELTVNNITTTLGSIVITDPVNNVGLLYYEDYSATGSLDDLWIPNVGYVQQMIDDAQLTLGGAKQVPFVNATANDFQYNVNFYYNNNGSIINEDGSGNYAYHGNNSFGIYSVALSRYATYLDPFTPDSGQDSDAYIFNTVAAFSNPLSELMSVRTANNHIFTVYGDGHLEATAYGGGSITGTATYGLGVDTNGNIVETDVGTAYTFQEGLTETTGTVELGGNITSVKTLEGTGSGTGLRVRSDNGVDSSGYMYSKDTWSFYSYNATGYAGTNGQAYLAIQGNIPTLGILLGYTYNGTTGTGAKTFRITSTSMQFTDTHDNKGLTYADDYSTAGTADDRWIPDWGAVKTYADGVLSYGTEDQIPVTNTAGDAFDYTDAFTFNSGTYVLNLGTSTGSQATIQVPDGGASAVNGKNLNIYAGDPYDQAGADGGDIVIKAGDARPTDVTSAPGDIYIVPGNPYTATAPATIYLGNGGFTGDAIWLQASPTSTNLFVRQGTGGHIGIGNGGGGNCTIADPTLFERSPMTLGNAGVPLSTFEIVGGQGTIGGEDGIHLDIYGGRAYTTGYQGGNVTLRGGNAYLLGNGGNAYIQGGDASASTGSNAGHIYIKAGNANSGDATSSNGILYLSSGHGWTTSVTNIIYLGTPTHTATAVRLSAEGSLTNIPLYVNGKGSGAVFINGNSTGNIYLENFTYAKGNLEVGDTGLPGDIRAPISYSLTVRAGGANGGTNNDGEDLLLYGGYGDGTGNGGNVLIYGGAPGTTGARGNVCIGDGSTNAYLPAKSSETNVVYYNTTTGQLSYGTPSGGVSWGTASNAYVVLGSASGDIQSSTNLTFSGDTLIAIQETSDTSDVLQVLGVNRRTSGTAAVGIGGYISISTEDAGGFAPRMSIEHRLTDVTSNTAHSIIKLRAYLAGSQVDFFSLVGGVGMTGYGAYSVAAGLNAIASATGSAAFGHYVTGSAQGSIIMGYHTTTQTNSLTDSFKLMWDGSTGFHVGLTLGTQITVNADPSSNLTDAANGSLAYDSTDHEVQAYTNSAWRSLTDKAYSGSLTDGTPTDAQLDSAIGSTPSAVGAGWKCIVTDTDGSALSYLVMSDGTNWQYVALTAAV